jgi:hypothetical protein
MRAELETFLGHRNIEGLLKTWGCIQYAANVGGKKPFFKKESFTKEK